MKFRITIVLLLLSAIPCLAQVNSENGEAINRQIDSLIENNAYFAAKALYESDGKSLSTMEQLQTEAVLDNVFNRLESSNEKISVLFETYETELPQESKLSLLELKQANYGKLYEYKKAYETNVYLLKKYKKRLTKGERNDYKNTNKIWGALADAPKQEVIIADRTVLQLRRDKAGLSNMEVNVDTVHIDFIFDTGANLSTVTETTAKRLRMRIIDVEIEVASITGLKVKSKLAVCPELNLGNIHIKNAVFLVFPDDALAVPQIKYQINGIIGFPVIEAMREIQITKTDEFIVPAVLTDWPERNLAFDFLTPVINLNGDSYTFDSGADQTMLYSAYYKKYKAGIEGVYKEEALSFGGAGGNVTKQGYQVRFEPVVSGIKLDLPSVMLFTTAIKDTESPYFGNIGQDVIRKFDKMTLNFESMFIKFD